MCVRHLTSARPVRLDKSLTAARRILCYLKVETNDAVDALNHRQQLAAVARHPECKVSLFMDDNDKREKSRACVVALDTCRMVRCSRLDAIVRSGFSNYFIDFISGRMKKERRRTQNSHSIDSTEEEKQSTSAPAFFKE